MSLRSITTIAVLAAGLIVPTIAHAARTTAAVNLRTGPGVDYRIITAAPPGAWVEVYKCVPRWCRVTFRGINGWMSAAYIGAGHRAYRPVKPKVYVRPALPAPFYYRRGPWVPYTYYRALWPRPYPYHRGPWRRW